MKDQGPRYHDGSLRLPEFDYSQEGAYFVTLVTFRRQFLFGVVLKGEMVLNYIGKVVLKTWLEIPDHFPYVNNDLFTIMPNHIHGIILIENTPFTTVAATHASQLPEDCFDGRIIQDESQERGEDPELLQINRPKGPQPGSLGAIIGSFKAAASKRIHSVSGYKTCKVWQRNYYEHVIRDDQSLQRIAEYILANPVNWEDDLINLPM